MGKKSSEKDDDEDFDSETSTDALDKANASENISDSEVSDECNGESIIPNQINEEIVIPLGSSEDSDSSETEANPRGPIEESQSPNNARANEQDYFESEIVRKEFLVAQKDNSWKKGFSIPFLTYQYIK